MFHEEPPLTPFQLSLPFKINQLTTKKGIQLRLEYCCVLYSSRTANWICNLLFHDMIAFVILCDWTALWQGNKASVCQVDTVVAMKMERSTPLWSTHVIQMHCLPSPIVGRASQEYRCYNSVQKSLLINLMKRRDTTLRTPGEHSFWMMLLVVSLSPQKQMQ
jgi:hypothetical protein